MIDYLQLNAPYKEIIRSFPKDKVLNQALKTYRGLRILQQEPWECLASFILSSTKQIPQIRQGIALISERFGNPVENDSGDSITFSFPPAETIALCSEQELRDCRIGFRAPYLKHAAESIRDGSLDLNHLRQLPMADARTQLTSLKGVGPKIADCVLLFGLGFHDSFPIDVWIHRILKRMYFEDRPVSIARLQDFSRDHFGPHRGYAQQFLFHYIRNHPDFGT
ncbi:MAG TPA: DNA-3-methyladenine glycosylase 2 family protein [Verrucomicrobiales bacterium]|nr:DNA-3-methyladenine glycosylase 2 family protein [Verrucomicrobiales bacterium]